ncbi:hypothetical protein DFJ58DRAFT_847267 [Suillus subalutaceus]|uniref:uncharacterized protein n=1 Tax=Suillus subalutaceus TaxID=48586 RepID=UPI001B8641E3|nr:uncharacterized protein DFJ58DRAFT_847267 [Suillus subalutaceus]KAG1835931.1 hypothetical protein DFJ58DRAFT_847267 [Suillus subalutaceus]
MFQELSESLNTTSGTTGQRTQKGNMLMAMNVKMLFITTKIFSSQRGFIISHECWKWKEDDVTVEEVLFRAGKAHDGYFTNQDITAHAAKTMNILEKDYPDEDHVLIFDNASTHLKRADDALSACIMPKGPSPTWGVSVSINWS